MKPSKSDVCRKFHSTPKLRFEEHTLTSYAGLVFYFRLFVRLNLKDRLRRCFRHLPGKPVFPASLVFLQLIVHTLLGYRTLRQQAYYRHDPMVQRVLGLTQLPDTATLSRSLAQADAQAIDRLGELQKELILERLRSLDVGRLTLDFDGTVLGTNRQAEGSAIGFNRKKKGQRSYYPLMCTLAQTGQVFDVLFRSGNVHDSNGARVFILDCIQAIRTAMPHLTLEVRMDAAFFSDEIVSALDELSRVEYTISVPFARFTELKGMVEAQTFWSDINEDYAHFERQWKPMSWQQQHRFLFIQQTVKEACKAPIQLDLFEPVAYNKAYTVILTNKTTSAASVMAHHHGRGSQEGLFAELKTQNQLDYVPCKHWHANQAYLLAVTFAHNLNRELQMTGQPATRQLSAKRPALWTFEQLNTQRLRLIQCAGRLLQPQGQLVLSMSANDAMEKEYRSLMDRLDHAA